MWSVQASAQVADREFHVWKRRRCGQGDSENAGAGRAEWGWEPGVIPERTPPLWLETVISDSQDRMAWRTLILALEGLTADEPGGLQPQISFQGKC